MSLVIIVSLDLKRIGVVPDLEIAAMPGFEVWLVIARFKLLNVVKAPRFKFRVPLGLQSSELAILALFGFQMPARPVGLERPLPFLVYRVLAAFRWRHTSSPEAARALGL